MSASSYTEFTSSSMSAMVSRNKTSRTNFRTVSSKVGLDGEYPALSSCRRVSSSSIIRVCSSVGNIVEPFSVVLGVFASTGWLSRCYLLEKISCR